MLVFEERGKPSTLRKRREKYLLMEQRRRVFQAHSHGVQDAGAGWFDVTTQCLNSKNAPNLFFKSTPGSRYQILSLQNKAFFSSKRKWGEGKVQGNLIPGLGP